MVFVKPATERILKRKAHGAYFVCIATRDSSNLLAHEAAFALGQMQDTDAIPALVAVLNDLSLHPIVRHEVKL